MPERRRDGRLVGVAGTVTTLCSVSQALPVYDAERVHGAPMSLEEVERLAERLARMTVRERQVLQLIAEGRANKQIAAELCISIKTVEKHRQQVMNKLNIHDVAGLTRYAISKGMVERSLPAVV